MKLYRYDWAVYLRTFEVIKETPQGYWIDLGWGEKKWVSNNSKKRFAYPTQEEALSSFIARKRRQAAICQAQADSAKELWRLASDKYKKEFQK